MDKNTLKKLPIGMSVDRELYDGCSKCDSYTPLADIHLFSGECGACYKPKRKYTDKQLRNLVKLDVGMSNEII